MEATERYFQVLDEVLRGKRWSTDTDVLRLAALTVMSCPDSDAVARTRATAVRLGKKPSPLRSMNAGLRLALAAMLVRRRAPVDTVLDQVERGLAVFRRHGLRHRGAHPRLAAMMLALEGGGVDEPTVERMATILHLWKKDHFFLTGIDDYLMAALHASRPDSPQAIARRVEAIYQALRHEGMSRGNQLQLASHLLALASRSPGEIARRFGTWAEALRERGQRIWSSQYDEVALLVLSGVRIDWGATRVIALRDALRARKPRPHRSMAFSIASGLLVAERLASSEDGREARTAATLRAIQSLIEAQQAVMVAAIAATSTAVAAGGAS